MKRPGFLLVGVVFLSLACDDYGSGPETGSLPLGPDYSGTFSGTAGSEAVMTTMGIHWIALYDDYENAIGSYTIDSEWSGAVELEIHGSTLSFDFRQETPCSSEFRGTGSIQDMGDRLTGTFTGTSPCIGDVNASFVVDRN